MRLLLLAFGKPASAGYPPALAGYSFLGARSKSDPYGFSSSMSSSANGVVISIVLLRIAVFLPAAAGKPAEALMIGSRMSSARNPPQPVAPGAAQALSTSLLLLSCRIRPSSRNLTVPEAPSIEVLGGGGLVFQVVSSHQTGELEEPRSSCCPGTGFRGGT